jgi:hypothetical protein
MAKSLLLFMLAALLFSACSTAIVLTDRGERVQQIQSADLPAGCRLLGDVSIGIPPDAARPRTEQELVYLMRNKAAERSATHVIVESSERQHDAATGDYYLGRGLAYTCPETREERPVQAPPEEETQGGEAAE